MSPISLQQFPAQQKTSTLWRQKTELIWPKFKVESNGFVPSFYKELEVA